MLIESNNRFRSQKFNGATMRKLVAERLEDRYMLAAVSFEHVGIVRGSAWKVEARDFTGDGIVDLASVDRNMNVAQISVGNGDGTFRDRTTFNVGWAPITVASDDLDDDGDLDLVVGNRGSFDITILFNDGSGRFDRQTTRSMNFEPAGDIVIADLNEDRILDLVVSSFDGVVGVLLGNGAGRFGKVETYFAHESRRLLTADVNADGHPDLVASRGNTSPDRSGNATGSGFSVLLNSGLGSFDAPITYEAQDPSNATSTVAYGDIDADGKGDLVAAWGANRGCAATVFSGNGDGTFIAAQDYLAGAFVSWDVALRDLNNDGHLDLVTSGNGELQSDTTISVLVGNADGTFDPPRQLFVPHGAWWLTIADLNGDGLADIATTGLDGVGILLNTPSAADTVGDGQEHAAMDAALFSPASQCIGNLGDESRDATFGDLDGDGDLDAFIANDGTNEIWINDGSGYFEQADQRPGSSTTQHVALGDIDGDGDVDAFLANSGRRANEVWVNNGSGVFEDSGQNLGRSSTYDVVLGDVDGDGDLDAFAANASRQPNELWLNDGTGIFMDSGQQLGQSTTRGVALGDVDGDGDLDAVDTVEVWLNDGKGQFVGSGQQLGGSEFTSVELADLDGGGDLDVFVGGRASTVWLNDGRGVFQDTGQQLRGPRRNSGTDLELADLDGDGDIDAFITNSSTANDVWLNDGDGVFHELGQYLDGTSSNGVALGDVDGDGDMDAMLANNFEPNSLWINDSTRTTPIRQPGDANQDFQFDQQDIVAVLQGAKYLTGEPADWSEGDWDGNGVFDQLDIVLALATGNYLQGPYTASTRASAVDELLARDDFSTQPLDEEWLERVS